MHESSGTPNQEALKEIMDDNAESAFRGHPQSRIKILFTIQTYNVTTPPNDRLISSSMTTLDLCLW